MFAVGCDPAAGIRLRSHLVPVPTPECVQVALARSPLVATSAAPPPNRFEARRGERRYLAVLADSGRQRSAGNLTVRTLGDSVAAVTLDFAWIGRLRNVPDTTRRWLVERGTAVVSEVRAACGPQAPDSVTCERYEGSRNHPPPCDGPAT